ncbi:MAG: penicillin-binding protein 2 [Hyphomicrobiales bacterium]
MRKLITWKKRPAPDYAKRLRFRFSRRALLLGAGQAGLFGLLGWRLHELQILDSSDYRLLSDENRMTVQLVAPARGIIYDRFGEVIAQDTENLRVLVLPAFCKSLPGTLDALASIVPVSAGTRDRVIRAARRQSGYYPVLVAEGLSWRQFALLNVLAPQIPGVRTDRSAHRIYHHATAMAHVVGYVGMAGKDEVDLAPVMRLPGFRTGRAGAEKAFDPTVRGSPGAIKYEVDAHGRVVRELGSRPSTRGRDVVLTIDQHLQTIALDRLKEHRVASIVVLDVVTGGILVMASTPSYDPNAIAFNPDPEQWRTLAKAQDNPFENRAIRGVYPPGSTFKVANALAGLTHGVITPDETMTCPGGYLFGRRTYRCWKRHGTVNLHEAIKQSCDVYFYETGRRLGIDRLAAVCRDLGLGQTFDFGLAGQKPGIMPDTAWKQRTFNEQWWPGETISCAIGQGFVASTPLQLAVMAARIATGTTVVPRLTINAQGTSELPQPLSFDPVHLDLVRSGMIGVVNEKGGTAVRSALQIPNVQMAGKTGTSQVISSKNEHLLSAYERETHALFIAFAPAHAPRLRRSLRC